MRLFTAIALPQEILLRLDRLMAALRPEALIKWSPLDNLHITTKFIGEWPEARLDELHSALADAAPRTPFEVEISGLGWFPNERAPRVLWAGVHGAEPLSQLARDTDERLQSLGIPHEDREFSPHLTLARIKSPVPLRPLRERVARLQPAQIGKFEVSHFALYRSDPGSNASIYRKLREYKFEASMAASSARQ
ncbi:MAG TPA: RNA 2',3'-cyclic phosphodiesterase [Bryobacteraceae bacterium]|jgi:2'-5' RNA ligase|nr:RNA 2',3'-cyclic phosphodiesterase [Bryobacteraceae bacterium]